jgi:hypothetical protein
MAEIHTDGVVDDVPNMSAVLALVVGGAAVAVIVPALEDNGVEWLVPKGSKVYAAGGAGVDDDDDVDAVKSPNKSVDVDNDDDAATGGCGTTSVSNVPKSSKSTIGTDTGAGVVTAGTLVS